MRLAGGVGAAFGVKEMRQRLDIGEAGAADQGPSLPLLAQQVGGGEKAQMRSPKQPPSSTPSHEARPVEEPSISD